ncbi:MAG: hypothetical protein V1796_08600 [Pseudomonadota bacterium]
MRKRHRFPVEQAPGGEPEDLLAHRPLSAAALADEADEWKSIGRRLEVKPLRDAAARAA